MEETVTVLNYKILSELHSGHWCLFNVLIMISGYIIIERYKFIDNDLHNMYNYIFLNIFNEDSKIE